MVQIANFDHPFNNISHSKELGLFNIMTIQLHGNQILHRVTYPIEGTHKEIALFAQPTVMPMVDVLRTVHDLMFLWVSPVTDPRALIMTHRDKLINAAKEQVRELVGGNSWPVRQFHKVDETPQTTLHLSRYHDAQLDRIVTMVVGTPAMAINSCEAVESGQGVGFVRVSPSWIDPGPFTLHDEHYGKTDDDVAAETLAEKQRLAELQNQRA